MPGLFRRSNGFAYLRNGNTTGNADISFFFGDSGDIPLVGDYNGDGCDTLSLYRPSTDTFHIVNRLGEDGGGLGPADFDFVFGADGDLPFVGDFDGNGTDDVGMHDRDAGLVYYRLTLDTGPADNTFFAGDPGDVAVTGDWNGDGTDTLAFYRPDDREWWFLTQNAEVAADHAFWFGGHQFETIQPIAGPFGTSSRG